MSLPEPIAKYEAYNRTNESDGREILTDLTGNGHDIQLYNFAFAENSGYGLYSVDMNSIVYKESDKSYRLNYNTFNLKGVNFPVIRFPVTNKNINFTINVNIKNEYTTNLLDVYYTITGVGTTYIKKSLENGINNISYVIPEEDEPTQILIAWRDNTTNVDVDIEFIPDYKGALVSDGVDDYGLCENFPILTKERGYTVCALRKILKPFEEIQVNACLLSNYNNTEAGSFYIENRANNSWSTYSFGGVTNNLDVDYNNDFVFQTSLSYNNYPINKGENTNSINRLYLFRLAGWVSSYLPSALYALEIYDRDLTDSEINAVKARMLEEYNNQEDTTSDWYGIEWYTNQSSSAVTRIGNVNLHKSLPIQSGMYRCVLNDNGEEVYKLDPNDSTKKEDVTPAVLDGTDGMVMVRIPMFYAKFETKGYRRRVLLSDHYKPGFMRMGGCYISAYEATIDRTTSGTPKLASVVNETANFRGGNNNAEWDGTYRSLLGMPATVTSLTNFRTYARNRKADNMEWNCMDYHAYKSLYWLYVVEYANRNCQLAFNDELTAEGYRQGGLGKGVTNLNGGKWSTFNGYYPFIPCGYTNSLGNKTGVVAFTMPDEYDAETPLTTYVPSYRGVENPFGHIWKWTDGLHIKIQSEEAGGHSILYTADDPASYQDTNYDGYNEIGDIARTEGYVKDILFDDGEMLPTVTTGSSSTKDFSDYFYTNIPASGEVLRGVLLGGSAYNGASAGFSSSNASYVPSATSANVGSRLCYIPNNNN